MSTTRGLVVSVLSAGLILAPVGERVHAAPAEADEPPLDTDTDEPPLDTDEPPLDTDEPPLDTDTDEPPLDTDEPPLDAELDADIDADEGFVEDDYNPILDSPDATRARRWLGAGIAATVAGGILVIGAVAMSQTDPCDPYAGNNCFDGARDRAALTMGLPGAVLLLGGVAMTTYGGIQRRRLWFGLAADRRGFGLSVSGKF